mgnify:CR=1 FL=1
MARTDWNISLMKFVERSVERGVDRKTATELADIFLGSHHDLVFLAGHFSTGSCLAADYQTRLTAAQVRESGADLLNTLIFSVGCHSGYNTVDSHAINGITKQPDWAQAFSQMGATLIAGTGYHVAPVDATPTQVVLTLLDTVKQIKKADPDKNIFLTDEEKKDIIFNKRVVYTMFK